MADDHSVGRDHAAHWLDLQLANDHILTEALLDEALDGARHMVQEGIGSNQPGAPQPEPCKDDQESTQPASIPLLALPGVHRAPPG